MTPEEQAQFLSLLAAILYRTGNVALGTPAEAVNEAYAIYLAAQAKVKATPIGVVAPENKP